VLWMQDVWHWGVIKTGFAVAPAPAMVPIVTILAQRLVKKVPGGLLAAIGCLLFAVGTILELSMIGSQGSGYAGRMLPGHLLVGVGIGLALPTILSTATHDLPPHRASTGSGVINMTRQLGFVLGVSIVVAILGAPASYHAAHTVFVHAWWTIAAAEVAAAIACLGMLDLFPARHRIPTQQTGVKS
jgi:hypothetical protein